MNFIKKIAIYIFALILISCAQNNSQKENISFENAWDNADSIISNIVPPKFSQKEFNILDFGAKIDSNYNSRPAIQSAINECTENGGGIVIIPRGTYYCAGSIILKNNVNLHLENGAIINFSTTPKDYLPIVFTRWEGVECYNYSALIYAKDQENIALTGKGILNGKASSLNWWAWKGKKEFGSQKGMHSQSDSLSRPLLLKMNNNNTPVEKRKFGEGTYLRPNFFQVVNCKNILVEDVKFIDSPMWFMHPLLSENITIKGVQVDGAGPNNDGCDPESCKNVLIEDCSFNTGDDCIAIKSGRNNDGRRIGVPSENIIIRNCKMNDGHGGVVIGSEISGGCKNVFAENCIMDSPNLDRALRIKTNSLRGGIIENVFVRNITIGEVGEAIVKINLNYDPKEVGERKFLPQVRNVFVKNLKSKKSKYAFFFDGLEKSKIQNIFVQDCNFNGVQKDNIIKNVEKFSTDEVYINEILYSVK